MDVSHDDSSLASQNSPSKGDFAVKSNDESGMNMSMCPQKTAAQLEREMEKQKIREEIIASEIRRRRELEDEVRMELLIEKRILGMGNVSGFSNFDHNNNNNNNNNSALLRNYGVLGSRYGPNFPEHVLNLGASDDVFGAKMKLISAGDENSIVGIEGMQQMDEAAIGKWPFDRDPSYVATQVAEKCNAGFADEVMSEAMSSAGITGMKRKAETPAEACDKETSRPTMSTADSQNKWFCAICGVSATSEVTLNSHFQGKKHRTKEAMYKANNTNAAIVMANDALTSVSGMSSEQDNSLVSKKWECLICQVSANSEDLLRSHMQGKKHKAKEAKLLSGEITANANKVAGENATVTVGKWYCSLCGVSASSESNLTAHLNGKKHKAKAGVREPQQEGDNANRESPKKDSEVEVMKEEKCSDKMKISEPEPITKDEGTESELERDVADKSSMTKTDANENPVLGSTSDLIDAKVSVTEGNQQESVLEASKDTEEIEKQSNLRMEYVKYWHCKMCNQGTHDEAAMAAHRKSSSHMTLLKSQGGGLITVASIPKNAPES